MIAPYLDDEPPAPCYFEMQRIDPETGEIEIIDDAESAATLRRKYPELLDDPDCRICHP